MSRIQWFALYYIHSNHGLTQKALAQLIMVREPTVARVLQELEQMELVERRCERSDKRQRHLYLTGQGESRFLELLPVVERFKTETVAHISAEHLIILKDCLEKMVENASAN